MGSILIIGGSLVNKGAQAMTYVTVCEMKKRFPDKEIIVAMNLRALPKGTDLNAFKFRVVDDTVERKESLFLLGGIWSLIALKKRANLSEIKKVREIWKNVEYVFDISGYAIGKKWGTRKSCRIAMKAALAKKYNAHCIFLPQSFGPFDFNEDVKLTHKILRKWLSCADVLYAREASGKTMLEELGIHNVETAEDIVLQNKEYDIDLIYNYKPEMQEVQIEKKSVALIPNQHIASGKVNDAYRLWDAVVKELLERGYTVYLMMHDNSDLGIIKKLKEQFKDDGKVILLTNNFSCVEFNKIVNQFEFLVASRYHSIVHAYRNTVPCIAIGWADKYGSLLESVQQERYVIDMRERVDEKELLSAIDDMIEHREANLELIRSNVERIQKESVFEKLER